ncbi:MAG: hypothetical protein IJD23_00840 [Spirochaetaceae bacterium]|nr:hypothetical protein [Spirochaetaceae bacterium]
MKTLDKEKLHLGEEIEDKTENLTQEENDKLTNSDKEILEKYSSDFVKSLVENKLSKSTASKKESFTIKPSFVFKFSAVAAVLALALILPLSFSNSTKVYDSVFEGESAIRIKGKSSALFVYRNENGKAVRLSTGTKVSEGDILQLSYVCADPEYALIVSVDGNGVVTSHFPEDSTNSALLEKGGEFPLSYSYKLDDAPSFERFYLVTSDKEFSLDSIEDFLLSISGISGKIDIEELSNLVGSEVSISDIMLIK